MWEHVYKHTTHIEIRRDIFMERHFYPVMGKDDMPEYISVISSSRCGRIRIDDIEAIEQEGRKLHVVTPDRDYSFYARMTEIIPALIGRAFYRPIKGLIINFDHVKDISGGCITFYSGQSVTLGKNSITKTRSAFKRYLLSYPPYSLWDRTDHMASSVAEPGFSEFELISDNTKKAE